MPIEIITIIIAAVNFLLGVLVYLKNREHLANRSFALFSVVLGFWALSLYFYSQAIILSALIWIKIVYFLGTFPMGLSLLYFSYIFPGDSKKFPRKALLIWAILSIVPLYLLFFTNLWVKEVVFGPWGYETIFGSGFAVVMIYSTLVVGWVIFNFIKKYFLTTNKVIRNQIKYVLLGIFLFMITVTFIDMVVPLVFNTTRFFGLSPVSSIFLVVFIMFAITRYHLFEIRTILTEVLVVTMGLILMVFPLIVPTTFLKILTVVIFLLFCLFSYLLIKTTYREIERRERTERISKELEEANARSETLLTSISDGVFAVDKEENIVHFNQAAESLTGHKIYDVLGKPYYESLQFLRDTERDKIVKFVPKALEGKTLKIDSILIRKDGRELFVEATAAPIKRGEKKIVGAIIVFRDTSKERKIQQMQAEFSSLVSHEIMSPITVIKGYLEVLVEEAGKLTKEQREAVNNAKEATKSLVSLIEELINVSRLEREDKEIEFALINPVELANKAITKEILRLFENKKQKFILKKPKTLPKIKVNPVFVITPIQNLLSNASKYTPKGGKIELKIYRNPHDIIFQDEVVFQVTDTGVGIPKGEQNKVFQRFFRASNTTQLARGTGLGLYLTKLMIELSGGRVWFKSIENKGTTFYFSVPVSPGL